MANYCVSPNDTFWTECKIVSPSDYNGDFCGFITAGSTYNHSYNSDAFPRENSCVSAVSSKVYSKFDETGMLEKISTKQCTNYQQTSQQGCTLATTAVPIYQDAPEGTMSHASDLKLLNRSRCPLAPINCNYDNAQNYKIMDYKKMSTVTNVYSNYGLSETTQETRYPAYNSQRQCVSNIEQPLPTIETRYLLPTVISNPLLETKVPDSYHLPTSSVDTTIPNVPDNDGLQTSSSDTTNLKGKKIRRHIPHFLRPQDFVERRNSRERKRIGSVNDAFEVLRRHIPSLKQKEGASKINILRFATEYIRDLGSLL